MEERFAKMRKSFVVQIVSGIIGEIFIVIFSAACLVTGDVEFIPTCIVFVLFSIANMILLTLGTIRTLKGRSILDDAVRETGCTFQSLDAEFKQARDCDGNNYIGPYHYFRFFNGKISIVPMNSIHTIKVDFAQKRIGLKRRFGQYHYVASLIYRTRDGQDGKIYGCSYRYSDQMKEYIQFILRINPYIQIPERSIKMMS